MEIEYRDINDMCDKEKRKVDIFDCLTWVVKQL